MTKVKGTMAKQKKSRATLRKQVAVLDNDRTDGMAMSIPYDQLVPSGTLNARAGDYRREGIDELAALIRAKGLIHPLTVRRNAEAGKWEVYDGGRRYAAIGKLIEARDWPTDRPVPCVVRDEDDVAAKETSLVANIAREPMHPVRE